MGRNKLHIDWQTVAELIQAGANGAQVCSMIGVSYETITRRCLDENNINFGEFLTNVKINKAKEEDEARKNMPAHKKYLLSKQNKGYVYLIRCLGSDFYKIGISKLDVGNRVATMQSGCPFELKVIHVSYSDHYSLLEAELHRRYKLKRVRGEWFEFTDALVLCVKNDMDEQSKKQLTLFK